MASRCSGPILNCLNHKKPHLRCLFPDTVAPFLFAFLPSKRILGPLALSSLQKYRFVASPISPRPSSEKKKPENCMHSYFALALPLTTKKLSISSIYILISETNNQHVSCTHIVFLIFSSRSILSFLLPVLICFTYMYMYVYTMVSFIYTLSHCPLGDAWWVCCFYFLL